MQAVQNIFSHKTSHLAIKLAAVAMTMAVAQAALADGFQRGPDPTVESVSAAQGPFPVVSATIGASSAYAYGYKGAKVFYPKDSSEKFGVVTLTPGFTGTAANYAGLASHIASFGFVVVDIDTITVFDQPDQRAKEMAGALKQVLALANKGQVPYAANVDVTRRAVIGHSMGGGGALIAASADSTLKAAVAWAPWSLLRKNFSADSVPTMIVECQNDTTATNSQHSDVFYASFNATLERAKVEVKGGDHLCPFKIESAVVKATVSWLKLFVDGDTRYEALVKGDMNTGDFSRFDVQGF